MSSRRLAELFHVLKGNRRIVDEQRELADRVITETAADRALADHFREAATRGEWGKRFPELPASSTPLPVLEAMIRMVLGGGAGLHTLCLRVITERETLARALKDIQRGFEKVDITPRTDNLGAGARTRTDTPAKPPPASLPEPRPVKAGLTRPAKGRA
jgi:hypothetical protein